LATSLPPPQLQIDFALALEQIRASLLQEALAVTVSSIDIPKLDAELAMFSPKRSLAKLASRGLRGELLFATPYLLCANPRLLGYYRLLLGYSQKEFFSSRLGLSGFQSMEKSGLLRAGSKPRLPELCRGLNSSADALLNGLGAQRVTKELLDDLTLLTLGPQLRGGYNVKLGLSGTARVFHVISDIVAHAAVQSEADRIEITNAAGRRVLIEFAPDPDIIIREEMAPGDYRHIIAIEIKAGTDASNIHNRLGEAEKSHQKARASGYTECWTVVNVTRLDHAAARRDSPSTNRFYVLSKIEDRSEREGQDFSRRLISLTNIRAVEQRGSTSDRT
jgi:hypothetical protein